MILYICENSAIGKGHPHTGLQEGTRPAVKESLYHAVSVYKLGEKYIVTIRLIEMGTSRIHLYLYETVTSTNLERTAQIFASEIAKKVE